MVLEVQSSVMPSMITVGHWGLATEKPAPSWAMPTRSAAGRACACDQLVNPKMQAKQPISLRRFKGVCLRKINQ